MERRFSSYLLRFKELEEEEKQVKQDLEDAMEENRSLSIEKTVLCDGLNKWKIKYDNCPTNYNVYKHTHLNIHIKITAAILSIDILFTEVKKKKMKTSTLGLYVIFIHLKSFVNYCM